MRKMGLGSQDFDLIQELIGHSLELSNRAEWANKQNSSHHPARVRHVSELGQVDTCKKSQPGLEMFSKILQFELLSLPCQVPRFKRPPVIGIEIEVPTSEVLVCETLSNERSGILSP